MPLIVTLLMGLVSASLCYMLFSQYGNHGGNTNQVTSPSDVVEDSRENSDTPAPTVTANAETSDTENTFDDVIIKHAYSVEDFRTLDITIMELPEYGTGLGTKDNFNMNMTIENENVCVVVWGEEVIINDNDLNQGVVLIYPQMTVTLQITDGGYRPFAFNPDFGGGYSVGIDYWEPQLLRDASVEMGGNIDKYVFNSDGLSSVSTD